MWSCGPRASGWRMPGRRRPRVSTRFGWLSCKQKPVWTARRRSRRSRWPLLPAFARSRSNIGTDICPTSIAASGEWSCNTRAGSTDAYGPTQMIAGNVSFKYLIKEFKRRHGLDEAEMAKEVVLRYFGVDQFLVRLAPRAGIERSFRGNRLVPLSAVRRETVKALARRTSDWMIRNVAANGRMTYKYWPSRRRASTSNNMIRQWMASVCLGRIARERNDAALNELVEKNVRYNLDRFFRVENGRGFIQYEDKAKLGAAASGRSCHRRTSQSSRLRRRRNGSSAHRRVLVAG